MYIFVYAQSHIGVFALTSFNRIPEFNDDFCHALNHHDNPHHHDHTDMCPLSHQMYHDVCVLQ